MNALHKIFGKPLLWAFALTALVSSGITYTQPEGAEAKDSVAVSQTTKSEHTESASASQSEQPQIPQELIENAQLLEQNCYTLLRLSNELNYLVLYVNNSHINNLHADKKMAINALIKDLNSFINQILRDKPVFMSQFMQTGDIDLITGINHKITIICEAIAQHLNALLTSKLQNVQPFDFESIAKRSQPVDLSVQHIRSKIEQNAKKVAALRSKIDTVGLTWYNKVARKFDDKVVTPWQKYGLSKGLKVLSVTGILGALVVWEFGSFYKQNAYRNFLFQEAYPIEGKKGLSPVEIDQLKYNNHQELIPSFEAQHSDWIITPTTWLEKFLGKRIPTNRGYEDHEQMRAFPGSYGKFSHFVRFLENGLSGHSPLTWMIGGYALLNYKTLLFGASDKKHDKLSGGLYGWLTQNTQHLWNKARGGLHNSQKIDGMWDFEPKITFEDVIGLDEAKLTLAEILDFVENMDMHMNINIAPEMGYLLTGKTRTGKTYIFEALCGEIVRLLARMGKPADTFKFKIIPAEHIIHLGIKEILEWAKSQAPMILFIDEIDLLNLHRVGNTNLLSEFLTALGSAFNKDPKKPIIIISATNRPDKLDPALRQPGRLGKEIRFERPPLAIRKNFLVHQFNKMAIDVSQFDLDLLAQKTAGNSIEDLQRMIGAAIRHSWMFGKVLSQELLEHCINTQLRNVLQINDKQLSQEEEKIVAAHFAGRAIAQFFLPLVNKVDMITVKPILTALEDEVTLDINLGNSKVPKKKDAYTNQPITYGGIFCLQAIDTLNFKLYDQTVNEIKTLVAGFAAEELLFGQCAYTCHAQDHNRALEMARALVFCGLDEKNLSKDDVDQLSKEAYRIFKQCKDEVKGLLKEHLKALKAIADALQEYKELNGIMVQFVIDIAEGRIDIEKLKAEYESEQAKTAQLHKPD